MTSPSPETLAEMARVDVQTALDEDRDDGETRQQTAARLLAEGVDGRWTPPSGDAGCEPTPEAQAYWAAVRTHLEEIAHQTSGGVQVDDHGRDPTTGEYIRVDQHPDGCRCPGHAAAPTPPPADGPGLAQSVREFLASVGALPVPLRVPSTPAGRRVWDALGVLSRALAAEEARDRSMPERMPNARGEFDQACAAVVCATRDLDAIKVARKVTEEARRSRAEEVRLRVKVARLEERLAKMETSR